MSAKAPSLADLVAQDSTPHGPRCWLCSIPHRKEAETLFLGGVAKSKIERALQKLYPGAVTIAKVSAHFSARHHER